MTPLFAKLNLKDHKEIVVLDAPPEMEPRLDALDGVAVHRDAASVERVAFALAFVTDEAGVDAAAGALLPKAEGDAIVWLAYPKGTSKRYRSAINRDAGWAAMGRAGFEAVRQVAIDEDWSALRFRRVEHVRSMTRDPKRAATDAGKARTAPKGPPA